jgi:hypothetical protein
MTAAVCPYCRGPIDSPDDAVVICEGCETPHHNDCYQENGGCTVFGCKCGPADEPKLRVSSPDLLNAAPGTAPAPVAMFSPPPSPITAAAPNFTPEDHKAKVTFIILGVLLGALGAHNFYAGYKKKALMQLGLTVFTLGYAAPMSWIWAVIDICTIDRDSSGVQFNS